MTDEDGLTPEQTRRYLLRSITHQELLISDALACGLRDLYQRRRDKLRQLRDALAGLDHEKEDTARAHPLD